MPSLPPESATLSSFAAASTALAATTNWAAAVDLAATVIQGLLQPAAYALVWRNGSTTVLAASEPDLVPPTPSLAQLAQGRATRAQGWAMLPLLAGGVLRGWLALQTQRRVGGPCRSWLTQLAAALALLEHPLLVTRESALLDQVGRMVRGTLALPELLHKLADIVCTTLDAPEFTIALLDPGTDQLSFAYTRRNAGEHPPSERWSSQEGLTGVVVRSGQVVNIDDYLAGCRSYGVEPVLLAGMQPANAWLGVPLVHQDHKLGVLVASTRNPATRYSTADERFMLMVADQAAAAVANAQLYTQVEAQAQQLRLINQIGRTISRTLDPRELPMLLAQALREALDVADVLVLVEVPTGELEVRYDLLDETLLGQRVPPGVGLAAQALSDGQVIHADWSLESSWAFPMLDEAGGVQSLCVLCAPLHNPQVRGVIQLRNKRGGHFTAADEQLLIAVAEQAAIALGNAEQYTLADTALAVQIRKLEWRNEQLTQVVALGNTLQSQSDAAALALEIARTVSHLTRCERVVIALVDESRQTLRPTAVAGFAPTQTPYLDATVSVAAVAAAVADTEQLGSFMYRVGAHPLLPGFGDALVMTVLDRRGALIGVIAVDVIDRTEPLSRSLIRTLEIVANQTAIAVANMALAAEQEQTVDRLTALNALSLAVNTAQLELGDLVQMTVSGAVGTTGGVGGGALVLNENVIQANWTFRLPAALGDHVLTLLDQIDGDYTELQHDEVLVLAPAASLRRVLIVPLRGAKLTVGALWLGFAQDHITQTEREMAVLYAKMAGAVIENLNLFAAVRAARDRMAAILASTHEGILLVDGDRRVAQVNSAFGELLGVAESRLIHRSVDELFGDHSLLGLESDTTAAIVQALHAVLDGSDEQFEGEFTLTGAVLLDISWTVLRAHGDLGSSAGALWVAHDVTADRQMEKLRQDMSSMIVHDLRSPLTNMMISIDLLTRQLNGPINDDQLRILQIASSSCQQMLDMVNDLLDIRRLESKSIVLQRQANRLAPIVETVIERLERIADDRRIKFRPEVETTPLLQIDREIVRRVLQNLMDNALKFSPNGGEVAVISRVLPAAALPVPHLSGDWALVAVRDQGPGIPEAYQAVIFELFGQAPSGRGRGTGLGLSFCKLAVEAHGGAIWVESALEQGSTFYFTLPVARS